MTLIDRWASMIRPRAAARDALLSVASEPWLASPEPLQAAFEVVRVGSERLTGAADIRAAMDYAEEERRQSKPYVVRDRVAIIHVSGLIMREVPCAMRFFGVAATSTLETQAALQMAIEDEDVGAVFLEVDSPGGTLGGLAELGDDILAGRDVKPVYAHVPDLSASAAYWITAQATKVTAGRTASIGSVGVYRVLVDTSKKASAEGVRVVCVSTGPLKGTGVPGTEITEAQLRVQQELVDRAGSLFRDAVVAGRPTLAERVDDVAAGRTWFGPEALDLGLIDAIASRSEAFKEARQAANPSTTHEPATGPNSAPFGAGGTMPDSQAANASGTTETPTPEERLAALEERLAASEAKNTALEQRLEQEAARAQLAEKGLADRRKSVLDRHQARGAFDPADRPEYERLAEAAYASDPDALDAFLGKLESKDHPEPSGGTGAVAPGNAIVVDAEALKLASQVGLTAADLELAEDTKSFSMLSNRRTTLGGEVVQLFERKEA